MSSCLVWKQLRLVSSLSSDRKRVIPLYWLSGPNPQLIASPVLPTHLVGCEPLGLLFRHVRPKLPPWRNTPSRTPSPPPLCLTNSRICVAARMGNHGNVPPLCDLQWESPHPLTIPSLLLSQFRLHGPRYRNAFTVNCGLYPALRRFWYSITDELIVHFL